MAQVTSVAGFGLASRVRVNYSGAKGTCMCVVELLSGKIE